MHQSHAQKKHGNKCNRGVNIYKEKEEEWYNNRYDIEY